MALIVVDTTIVNVIVPSIVRDLGVTSAQAQWIQESYAIVFAALLLVVGRVADILGARRVFLAGVVVFGVTSLLAGLAPTVGSWCWPVFFRVRVQPSSCRPRWLC